VGVRDVSRVEPRYNMVTKRLGNEGVRAEAAEE